MASGIIVYRLKRILSLKLSLAWKKSMTPDLLMAYVTQFAVVLDRINCDADSAILVCITESTNKSVLSLHDFTLGERLFIFNTWIVMSNFVLIFFFVKNLFNCVFVKVSDFLLPCYVAEKRFTACKAGHELQRIQKNITNNGRRSDRACVIWISITRKDSISMLSLTLASQ